MPHALSCQCVSCKKQQEKGLRNAAQRYRELLHDMFCSLELSIMLHKKDTCTKACDLSGLQAVHALKSCSCARTATMHADSTASCAAGSSLQQYKQLRVGMCRQDTECTRLTCRLHACSPAWLLYTQHVLRCHAAGLQALQAC